MTACQPGSETPPEQLATQEIPLNTGSPTGAPQPTEKATEIDPDAIRVLWDASPHAHTYVLDEAGMNSTCARCHAPVNYVPSMEDMPASCAACKFEVEPPPPTLAEADWNNIPCNVCHLVKKGVVDAKYTWLSIPPIDEYEEVPSTKELCLKCHIQIDVADHETPDLSNAHADFTCTQCHDAHSTKASSCASEDCHADILKPSAPIPGHDADHTAVPCWVCHDAAGLAVGLDDQDNWITLLPVSSTPYVSHNITRQTLCDRCHYLNNPWNLSVQASKSTP
jgi:hypothetical protein